MGVRGVYLALACAIAGSHAFANQAEYTPGGFYAAEALPWRPAHFEQVRAASLRLGNECSAVGLSSDGYVATALHCIAECFQPGWDYAPAVIQDVFVREGFYRARAVRETHPPAFRCPAHIARQFAPSDLSTDLFDLVWVGRGQQSHTNERIAAISNEEFARLSDLTEDVVILKFHPAPDQGRFPCLPTAEREPIPGSRLWSVGYPSRARRPNGLSSDGVHEFYSPGYVRASVDQDPVLSHTFAGLTPAEERLAWAREQRLWNQPHLLLSSVDAVGGNSGGLMVNEEGAIAGILFTTMKTSAERYLGTTVVGVQATHLKRRIAEALGPARAEEIFSCEWEGAARSL